MECLDCNPLNDPKRLSALQSTGLLDSPPEKAFDRFTYLASRMLDIPVSLVSLVDKDRQFFKSSVGLKDDLATSRETPISHSFCQHVVATGERLVVNDTKNDSRVRDNPAVDEYGVATYMGVPLKTQDGHVLGTLCAMSSDTREWTEHEIETIECIASMVLDEIELRLLAKSLQEDYQKLRDLELQRDELVHMLVHDMRNPLTSVSCGLDALSMSQELTDRQQRIIQLAADGADSLMKLINNTLDVHHAENKVLDLQTSRFHVSDLIESARDAMALHALKDNLELTSECLTDAEITADYDKLKRVLVNLVGNALDHTDSGGKICITAFINDEKLLTLSVSDTGCGISQDAFDRIFEKFGQLNDGYRKNARNGLGLCFSRMVAEAHGGRIWLESEMGQGSTFHVAIPA